MQNALKFNVRVQKWAEFQTCKSYAAELVDRCLDHCSEWLTSFPATGGSHQKVNEVDEIRRLSAAHLSRELALATPTAFFLRANLFFKYIFNAVKDKNPAVRIAAIDALHVVLTIVSQRETKHKTEWFGECFKEAFSIQSHITSRNEMDGWHSVALILNELLRISDQSFELVRRESSQFVKQKFLKEDEENGVEWLALPKQLIIVESVTARQLVRENFEKLIVSIREMVHLVSLRAKDKAAAYLNTVLMQLLPRICAFPQCDRTFQTIAFDTSFAIYVRGDLKDEPNSFSEAFLNAIDGRTGGAPQNAVYNCVKHPSIDQKKAGIYLIVCLAETHAGNVIRYANYLLKMLNTGGMDEETVKLASKALAFLIAADRSILRFFPKFFSGFVNRSIRASGYDRL
uniref:Uncharacterized protein n=1 Tax=Caenorhabditis japonica TaxID=281687 RepID=A0A8R1HYK1_CAEJA